jgi:shikimate dehydrogenase
MSSGRLRVGLIGDPVAHSISPSMQQPALDALGISATFELWHTLAADLPARIASLRAPDVLGANVTVPHKLGVMDHLDEVSPLARRAGAVNVIVHREGHLSGDNTDIHGFAVSLEEACPNARVRPALVLGAGGAARAVVLALEAMGVDSIALANRNPERAESLVADLAPMPIRLVGVDPRSLVPELRRAAILVNATSLGWHRGETPLPLDLLAALPRIAIVVDLTYRDTDLLEAARERGLATLDGLAMLVHQGARALELWTGRRAPVAVMMDAARRARAARA